MAVTAADWGIPTLDPALQLRELVPPVYPYGSVPRTRRTGGTVHFYTADAKFTRLMTDPARVLASGCVGAVEPNFSTGGCVSRAAALFGVYQRRRLASEWQGRGLRVAVDLNLSDDCLDLALLGVPRGWASFATRVHRRDTLAETEARHAIAARHAEGGPLTFVVVGGGAAVKSACRDRGWLYVPEHCRVVRGLESPYGTRRVDGFGGGRVNDAG